jgi:hypothetical protein
MQGEKEKVRDTTEGSGQQPELTPTEKPEREPNPVGQDSPKGEYGEIGNPAEAGAGSAPPRSLGTKGKEFGQMADYDRSGQQGQSGTGQADLGSQAGSTLSGHTDQQELGEIGGEVDQPGSYAGGVSGRQAEGFIGREAADSEEHVEESASSARAAEGQDFAAQGRGALEGEEEDVEGGRSRGGGKTDIERP